MLLHYGQVNRIASGQTPVAKDNLLGTLYHRPVNRQHFIHSPEQRIKGKLDVLMAIDRRVAVQNFLQDFGIGNQALALAQAPFQQPLRIGLVEMGPANQIHGDVGIDENHG